MEKLEQVIFDLDLPPDRQFQVIGFGENAVDLVCRVPHYPEHDTKVRMEKMLRMGGGQIATACSLCARFGLKTRYVGRVGDDDLGEFVRKDLQREPMEVSLEPVPGASNHLSLIIVDRPTGCRTILWDQDSKLRYREGELKSNLLVEGQFLHLDGNDLPASVAAARWAKSAGMRVSVDIDKASPGVEELIVNVDFLLASLSFFTQFSGSTDWRSAVRQAAKRCPGLVGITRGERGSAVLWEDEIHEFPAFMIDPVDSTGAGDVFHGAFIYALFQGWSLARVLRFSNAAGGLACTKLGARAGIPRIEEVLELERAGKYKLF